MTETAQQGWQLWQIFLVLIGIIAAWGVIIIAALQFMVSRAFKGMVSEKEFLEFKAELPEKYVRREDFIRFDVGINSKLDKLRDLIEEKFKTYQEKCK